MSQTWLNNLKIALVQKDVEVLSKLVQNLPELQEEKDIQEAVFLTKEVSALFQNLKDETGASMHLMQKNLDFLKSTHIDSSSKLDVTS